MSDAPQNDSTTDPTLLSIVIAILTALIVTAAVLVMSAQPGTTTAEAGPQTPVDITGAWVALPIGASTTTAAYFTIQNNGLESDTLIGGSSLAAAGSELHATVFDGGVMRMRPVRGIPVPAGGAMNLEPGGFHMMLTNITEPLVAGQDVRILLEFEKSGTIAIDVPVRDRMAMPDGASEGHGNGHGDDHGDHTNGDHGGPDDEREPA